MKKNLRRIVAVFMVVVLAAAFVPIADTDSVFAVKASARTYDGSLGGNVKWKYDSETKTITVSGSGNMKDYKNGGDGQGWTDYRALIATKICNQATKIVINEGVTNVGANAFRDLTKVTKVTLPSSVKTIGDSAFRGCSALTSVNLTESITSIGASAFRDTKFASVNMPYSVTSVGGGAFSGVSGLKITCNYGDAAYNYCVNAGASYTLRNPSLVISTSLDAAAKQAKVTVKFKDAAGFNAGNLVLTYDASALTPVSSGSNVSENKGVTTAIVYNEAGKISIAPMTSDCIQYNDCTGKCEFTVAELRFTINSQADEAGFTLSADPFMAMGSKISVSSASAKLSLHSYTDKVTKEATCVSAGQKTSTCSICGKTVTSAIAINPDNHTGKTETKNAKAATCAEEGNTGDKVCSDCGAVIEKGSVIAKIGHSYEKADEKAATCTENGHITYTCKVCGDTYNDETPALGHSYGEGTVTPPTCTSDGYTTYICTVCGEVLIDDAVPAAHDYEKKVTPPTCISGGYTVYTCKLCGDSYTGDVTAALGHDFNADGVCTRCGETKAVTASISFTDGNIAVNEDNKTVTVKTVIKAPELSGKIASGSWTVCSADGAALGNDDAVATGAVIKSGSSSAVYTVIIIGDANCDGKVSAADAREVLRYSAKLSSLSDLGLLASDANGDGKINASDARTILRVSAKLESFK